MKKKLLLIIAILSYAIASHAQRVSPNGDAGQALSRLDKLFFIENKGQWPSEVLYLTQMGGLNTWITTKGMLYEFYKTEEIEQSNTSKTISDKFEQKEIKRWGHRVAYNLIGNNESVKREGKQKQEGYYNYLIGNDASKHASFVGLYKEAVVKEVYAGIDMHYYFDRGSLRYDYIVHPGADASQIRFSLDGSDKSYLNANGELVFTTCFGEVKNAELYSYTKEDQRQVAAHFEKRGESWAISLGAYDRRKTVIVDPLVYSTYIGGSIQDISNSIAVDDSGSAYVTGRTISPNYIITTGAFQSTFGGTVDLFITKLNASGSNLVYSTYVGGSFEDVAFALALDKTGNTYITGYTASPNFDITAGAFQTTMGGGSDVFVSKLNASGTALIYSTYIGGSVEDVGNSIAVDSLGNAYVTGNTGSGNYDVTTGAFQVSKDGSNDVFITKLNSTGTSLIYSTYLGGSNYDYGNSIVIDSSGNAYVTGYTLSNDFDITSGAFQTTNAGDYDVFVSKLNATGSTLVYSTYIGGINDDCSYSVAVDGSDNAYITGYTLSFYPITTGAYQTINEGQNVFVSKLNPSGTGLVYSTFIGGSYVDHGYSIALDEFSNAYITGYTQSTDFDTTSGAFQTSYSGGTALPHDIFVSKLNSSGSVLLYSTYLGGISIDNGNSIAVDSAGNAYITGFTQSADFDTTAGAFQTTNLGTYNVFVTKLNMANSISVNEVPNSNLLRITPNPSSGLYKLSFENIKLGSMIIEVYDMQGKCIQRKNGGDENTLMLDILNEPSGIYLLKVKGDNFQEAKHLVKL